MSPRTKAERGAALAQLKLGYSYWLGQGIEQDEKEGVKWLTKAADQGRASKRPLVTGFYQRPARRGNYWPSRLCQGRVSDVLRT